MSPLKQRGAVGPSHSNDKAGEFARMKAGSAATMGELREFMSHMRGKSPQQIMGLVAESGLTQGIIISTIATAALLVVFTVLPYMIYGPTVDKAALRQAAAAEKAAADKAAAEKESAEQAEKEKGAEKSGGASKEKVMKSMTKDFDEVKGKAAGEVPAVDNLLDKLEQAPPLKQFLHNLGVARALTLAYDVVWLVCVALWMWFLQDFDPAGFTGVLLGIVFTASLPIGLAWIYWAWRPEPKSGARRALVVSLAYVAWWQWALFAMAIFAASAQSPLYDSMRVYLARYGLAGLFLLGLMWVVWAIEQASQFYELRRVLLRQQHEGDISQWHTTRPGNDEPLAEEGVIWNPLDPQAWMYGSKGKRLNQSLAALCSYSVLFFALFLASTMIGGCEEIYELPAGGGEQKTLQQIVKVQKIIRKKFVVNPFSAILFEVPPIDEVKLQLQEITAHAYVVGQGEGSGQAGFGAGTNKGAVRFIRLQYEGGDWDQDFGVGADLNMLLEYGIRTKHKIAKLTESRTIAQLKNFPIGKSPPLMYLTGERSISLSSSEVKILREYLLDKHGMLFGDNGGSPHFHNQFVGMMRQVLPNVRPVAVPLDDQIHRVPFVIPFLPYVAPHGGREALGWRVDGRWVCYYHPGDIGDAWSDGHSGVDQPIWEACFQLGTNVIFYAHAEYSKWVTARQKQ